MTHFHRTLVSAVAFLLLGCAGGQAAVGQAAPTAQQAQSARLLSDAVLLLPVHETTLEGSADSAQVMSAAFDTEFRRLLEPHASSGWMWPDAARQLHRRNPLNVPDPTRLATRDLRGSRLAPDEIVSAELGSQIRALLAVAGARRYVLLPLRLHAGAATNGGHTGGVTLVTIDARRSTILLVQRVATRIDDAAAQAGAAAVAHAIAAAAQREITGPIEQ